MIGHLFVKATQYSLYAGSILSVAPTGLDQDSTLVGWTVRCVLGLAMAAVAYLLNDTMKTIKATKKMVNDHSLKLAVHDVMYEQWLNDLMDNELPNHPTRRRSDIVLKAVAEAVKSDTKE